MADSTNVCTTCRFAEWDKASSGRLHPSGAGSCKWEMPRINLPVSMYFIGTGDKQNVPRPNGGYINRKELRPCPAWNLRSVGGRDHV